MATGVQNAFSTTAASNGTADTVIPAFEGQPPSTVNDAIRALMAAIKKWCLDWQGGLVTGGGSAAYTLATNETLTLADGKSVTCRMHATNGAAPTLNVDSTGAVSIQTQQGTAIPAGTLLVGGIYTFTYYASVAAWIVHGMIDFTAAVSAASETVQGKVELATTAEATTGTDTARAVTPAGLKAHVDAAVVAIRNGVDAAYDTFAELAMGLTTVQALIPTAASQAEMEAAGSTAVSATPGRLVNHPGVAKARARVNSAGALAGTNYGISSASRTSTGTYNFVLASAMADTNYSVLPSCDIAGFGVSIETQIVSTTVFNVKTRGSASDSLFNIGVSVAVFGDMP